MFRSEVKAIQNEIIKEFYNQFKDYKGGLNLAVPLIPRISPQYFENRTVVLGQETNTWYPFNIDNVHDNLFHLIINHSNELEKICLNDRYDRFIKNHVEKYGGKFWEYNRLLYSRRIISGNIVNNGLLTHCWINLFVTEAISQKNNRKGRPTSNKQLANKIINLQGDIISRLFRLLSPKRIIFLTGHSLDNHLYKTAFKDLEIVKEPIDKNNVLNSFELAKIKIQDKNHYLYKADIIRSYHPSYFMGKINSKQNKNLRTRILNKGLKQSNSQYYIETFISHLKQSID